MRQNKMIVLFAVFLLMTFTGCSSTKVTRVDVDKRIDLSGFWNDYDASLVSKEMIKDCLAKPWLNSFVQGKKRDPVVIVGHVKNRSDEHINAHVFTDYLERELTNSGKIVFVASPDEREHLREEREDQQTGYTSEESMKKIGKERGADFMLMGSMNSVRDELKGKSVVLYQVNLELIDLETNEKVWLGQKEIKKFTEKSKFSL